MLEVETRSVPIVHSETFITCSGNGGESFAEAMGVVVEEESILSDLSSEKVNVTVSTSLSLWSARLRLGMMSGSKER